MIDNPRMWMKQQISNFWKILAKNRILEKVKIIKMMKTLYYSILFIIIIIIYYWKLLTMKCFLDSSKSFLNILLLEFIVYLYNKFCFLERNFFKFQKYDIILDYTPFSNLLIWYKINNWIILASQ